MRISESEKQIIISQVRQRDPGAKIYLYGSRADAALKGGDIDLVVVSDQIKVLDKVDILIQIKAVIGEQKIDLRMVSSADAFQDEFVKKAIKSGVELV